MNKRILVAHGYAWGSWRIDALFQNLLVCIKVAELLLTGQFDCVFLVGGGFLKKGDLLVWEMQRKFLLRLGVPDKQIITPSLFLRSFRPPGDTFEEVWLLGKMFLEKYGTHPTNVAFSAVVMNYHVWRVKIIYLSYKANFEVYGVGSSLMLNRALYDLGAYMLTFLFDSYGLSKIFRRERTKRAKEIGLENMSALTNKVWLE